MRTWLKSDWYAVLVTLVAVAITSTIMFLVPYCSRPAAGELGLAYWYVPETREVFLAPDWLVPPIEHQGEIAVRVHFFGCGGCSEDLRFVGYYEKYSEASKARLGTLRPQPSPAPDATRPDVFIPYDVFVPDRFISIDAELWVLADSPAGQEIQEALAQKCLGKGKLTYCSP